MPAPSRGGVGFGQDGPVDHFGGAFGSAEIFAGLGFDDKIRLVDFVVFVIKFEFFFGGFDPFENVGVVFEKDGEAALGVGNWGQ